MQQPYFSMALPTHIFFLCLSTAPVFYFGDTDYHVDESDGYVEVRVWRTGTDLSKVGTVTVRSRKTDPVSAEGKELPSQAEMFIKQNITSQWNSLCTDSILLYVWSWKVFDFLYSRFSIQRTFYCQQHSLFS